MIGDEKAAAVAEALAKFDGYNIAEPTIGMVYRQRAAAVVAALDAQPGDAEQAGAADRVRRYVEARDLFYGREALDDDVLDTTHNATAGTAEGPDLLYSDLRILAASAAAAPGADAVRTLDECAHPGPHRHPEECVQVRAAADTGGERGAGG